MSDLRGQIWRTTGDDEVIWWVLLVDNHDGTSWCYTYCKLLNGGRWGVQKVYGLQHSFGLSAGVRPWSKGDKVPTFR